MGSQHGRKPPDPRKVPKQHGRRPPNPAKASKQHGRMPPPPKVDADGCYPVVLAVVLIPPGLVWGLVEVLT